MKGLYKSTGYWQTIEARRDWERESAAAVAAGHGELVERVRPVPGAGWRVIDRSIRALRWAMAPPTISVYCPQCRAQPGEKCHNYKSQCCAPHSLRTQAARERAA